MKQFDVKSLDKRINSFTRRTKNMDVDIHTMAMDCIRMSLPEKQGGHVCASRAIKLANAMPKSQRVKALVAWFTVFSNIRLRYDQKTKQYTGGVLKPESKQYVPVDLKKADAKPFFSVIERVALSDFTTDTLTNRVKALIKAATSDAAKLDAKGKAALADLQKLGGSLEATKA